MRTFAAPSAFATFLREKAVAVHGAGQTGLREAADIVEVEAKGLVGSYQEAAGPFAAWAELADSTKKERATLGYAPNDPLLRTGDLRASIGHTLTENQAVVGSESPIALDQEVGTSRIPARSFLGSAAFRKEHEVVHAIAQAVTDCVADKQHSPVKPGDQTDIPF